MKIGIDLRPLQEYSKYRGIGTVSYEIARGLVKYFPNEEYYFYFYTDLEIPKLPEILDNGKAFGFGKSGKGFVLQSLLDKIRNKKSNVKEDLDVFLSTDPNKKIPEGDFKKVVVFYDIIHLLFTQKYLQTQTKNITINLVKLVKLIRFIFAKRVLEKNFSEAAKADKILAISQTTKDDLVNYFKVPEEKVSVIHLAASDKFREVEAEEKKHQISKKYGLDQHYILYIGGLDYRKNVLNLVKSYALLKKKKNFPYTLVIIGKDVSRKRMPEAMEIREFLYKEQLWSSVKLIDYVSEEEKVIFYTLAEISVFPSLYEGFGLATLEAMKSGTPVVCSNISTIQEVAGDAALYFDPNDTEDMAAKISKVLNDKSLREKLREQGLLQAQKFSWEKTAKEVFSAF